MSRKEALLRLHKSLVAKRDALQRQLNEDLDLSHSTSGGAGDVCDAAMEGTQLELHSQLAALESRELVQIEKAIQQIREGTYGLCEHCSTRIPIARLKALPYSTCCVQCQSQMEHRGGRQSGGRHNWESVYDYDSTNNDKEITIGDLDVDAG